jgi:hypothetical protein
MRAFILACDNTVNQSIEMYDWFLNKYWPSIDLTILGYKDPHKKSKLIKFESLGVDRGPHQVNNDLYNFFSSIDYNFIFNVDDTPMIKPVDINLINRSEKLFKADPLVGRIGLTSTALNRSHQAYSGNIDNVLISLNREQRHLSYKLSAVWSAWDPKYFLKYLNNFNNLWEWETEGTIQSLSDNFKILFFNPPPIQFCHLTKRGKPIPAWHIEAATGSFEMEEEDQDKIKTIYKR